MSEQEESPIGRPHELCEDGEWAAGPALSVGIPLFDQQQGPRARAHAEIAAARNTGLAVVTEVRTRSRAVRQRLLGTYIEAKQLRDVVLPMRKRIVDETLLQYNAMNATPFELLVARRELVDAGRDYIDALRRFWRVSAEARVLARGGSLVATEDAVETRNNAAPAQHGGGH